MGEDGSAESAAFCTCVASWLFMCGLGAKNIRALCQPHAGSVPDPARTLWVCLTPFHPALPSLPSRVTIARSIWKGRAPASLSTCYPCCPVQGNTSHTREYI